MSDDVNEEELAAKYPAYWKPLPKGWLAIDTYRVNQLFQVDDPSGRVIHARKKLLVCGTRTGGKSMVKDIQEAYDTLGSWLADNAQDEVFITITPVNDPAPLGGRNYCKQCQGKGYLHTGTFTGKLCTACTAGTL